MAKRIYSESVKKWATISGISATTFIGLLFTYLTFLGVIEITGFSGDQICEGTELDPCYAYVNLTAKEDIFIYPIGYDPWGRNTVFEFSPGVKDWKLQRSWGTGWRDIPLNKTCTGTWCGAPNNLGVAYSYVLREGRDYKFRIVALKNSPYDKIKWAVNYEDREYLDPLWDTPYDIPETEKEILSDEYYQDALKVYDSLRVPNNDSSFYKSYNATTKTLLIEDSDFKKSTEYRLESKYFERIRVGNDVMFAELAPVEYTDDLFDAITMYSIDDDFQVVEKIVVKKWRNISIKTDCYVIKINLTNESKEVCIDYEVTDWIEFDSMSEIPKGSHVGLFTNTIEGEHIEWVIEKDGFAIYEWASYLVTDLVAYYNFDEQDTTGTGTIYDSLGDHNGTNSGTDNASGILNSAYDFEETQVDYINLPTSLLSDYGTNGTIIAWVKLEQSGSDYQYIMGYGKPSTGTGNVRFWIDSSSKLGFWVYESSAYQFRATTTSAYTWTDGWHQVAYTSNSSGNALYIDGSAVAITYATGSASSSYFFNSLSDRTNTIRYLGKQYNSDRPFDGVMDEVAIYERGLNASEILENYHLIGNGTGYPFEDEDTTPPTYSGIAHNNTVVGISTNFSIIWNDDTALNPNGQYIFSTNNTGTWINDSAVDFTSTSQSLSVIKILNSTSGIAIGYRWYASDNAGNDNDTGIQVLTTTTAPADTCTYTSGNWAVDCSDNCDITSNVNLGGNDLSLSGVGYFNLAANISNWGKIIIHDSNDCSLIVNSGGFI